MVKRCCAFNAAVRNPRKLKSWTPRCCCYFIPSTLLPFVYISFCNSCFTWATINKVLKPLCGLVPECLTRFSLQECVCRSASTRESLQNVFAWGSFTRRRWTISYRKSLQEYLYKSVSPRMHRLNGRPQKRWRFRVAVCFLQWGSLAPHSEHTTAERGLEVKLHIPERYGTKHALIWTYFPLAAGECGHSCRKQMVFVVLYGAYCVGSAAASVWIGSPLSKVSGRTLYILICNHGSCDGRSHNAGQVLQQTLNPLAWHQVKVVSLKCERLPYEPSFIGKLCSRFAQRREAPDPSKLLDTPEYAQARAYRFDYTRKGVGLNSLVITDLDRSGSAVCYVYLVDLPEDTVSRTACSFQAWRLCAANLFLSPFMLDSPNNIVNMSGLEQLMFLGLQHKSDEPCLSLRTQFCKKY